MNVTGIGDFKKKKTASEITCDIASGGEPFIQF